MQFHAYPAGIGLSLLTLATHALEGSHASFIARATRLDPLPNPGFLLGESLVEQRVLLLFGGKGGFFSFQKRVVVARPVEQPAAVQFHDAVGQFAKEHAIVRHEHQRRIPGGKELLQPLDGVDVQVIGWLVQQQQIGLLNKGPSQEHTPFHP